MARDGSGDYSLPSGNPVIIDTVIDPNWANNTLTDLASEVTSSLDRNGKGGMLAPFRGVDGVVTSPSYSFTAESNTGFYRAGAGDLRAAVLGTDQAVITSSGVTVTNLTVSGTSTFSEDYVEEAPSDGTQYVRKNEAWEALQAVDGGATSLNGLTDVSLTTPTTDQFMRYDGSMWVNETVSIGGDITDWFDVTAYGAVGNDSTNNLTAIQAAINAAEAAGGGVVYFPQGVYRVTGQLTINKSGVALVGQTATASIIKQTSTTLDTVAIGGAVGQKHCNIRDLTFTATTQKTNGAAIRFANAQQCVVERVFIEGHFYAVEINSCILITVKDAYIVCSGNTLGAGIVIGETGTLSNDIFLSRVVMNSVGTPSSHRGIVIFGAGAIWIDSCDVINCGVGLLLKSDVNEITWLFCSNSAFDTGQGNGITINATDHPIKACNFVNTWVASNAQNGIEIKSGNGTDDVDGVTFTNGRVVLNDLHGITWTGARVKNVTVSDFLIAGNNASAGTTDGILVGADTTDFIITGCTVGAVGGFNDTQSSALTITAGCSNFIVSNNKLNNTANISLGDNSGAVTKSVTGNLT